MVPTIDRHLSSLRIVVLAAGFSSRLGQPKALARVHGVSLLRRTIRVLGQLSRQRIAVVTPPRSTRLRVELRGCRVAFLVNHARAGGLSTSVSLAVRRFRYSKALLLLPADLAELSGRDVARLISRWRGAQRQVVARGIAGRPATPLILPSVHYRLAVQLSGDVGLRDLLAGLGAQASTLVAVPSAAFDVDTPQDLAHARQRAPRKIAAAPASAN